MQIRDALCARGFGIPHQSVANILVRRTEAQ
jgi:hypothetical protein